MMESVHSALTRVVAKPREQSGMHAADHWHSIEVQPESRSCRDEGVVATGNLSFRV